MFKEKGSERTFCSKSRSMQGILAASVLIVAVFAAMPFIAKPALATHGTVCNTQVAITCGVFWDRSTSGPHRVELECASSTSTTCKIPVYFDTTTRGNALTFIKGNPSVTTINSESSKSITTLNSATTKMGLVKKSPTSTWDNKVRAASFDAASSGRYTNVLIHCPQAFCFGGNDKHLQRVWVELNSNTNTINTYGSTETCDQFGEATKWDIEKVLNHELFHLMGFDHSSEKASPVYNFYQCGSSYGYTLTAHDKTAIQQKYP